LISAFLFGVIPFCFGFLVLSSGNYFRNLFVPV